MKYKFAFTALLLSFTYFSYSQTNVREKTSVSSFEHLVVSGSTGSMGVSLEAETPLNKNISVRAGLSYMPTVKMKMSFGVQVGDDEEENKFDEYGNRIPSNFDRMAEVLEEITGYHVDESVVMDCKANFLNAKFMIDYYPFRNKDWHFTAGFFWGTQIIGRAINTHEDMTTTIAVGMYNNIYDKIQRLEPIYQGVGLPIEVQQKFMEYGRMGMHLGYFKQPQYYEEDVYDSDDWLLHAKGDVRVEAGGSYMMEPDKDGIVRAWAKVRPFKPYVGMGWSHAMKDNSWRFGVDAGVVFWGGVPNIYTHDGTSLTRDVIGLQGKVGKLISFAKHFPVYPLLEIKVSKQIF